MKQQPVSIVGIAWFRHEDYQRCRQRFADADRLPDTFEQWQQAAHQCLDGLRAQGLPVERVYLDPDTFPAWCAARGLDVDAQARQRYAAEAVARKHQGQG